jgi:hypothetical protein
MSMSWLGRIAEGVRGMRRAGSAAEETHQFSRMCVETPVPTEESAVAVEEPPPDVEESPAAVEEATPDVASIPAAADPRIAELRRRAEEGRAFLERGGAGRSEDWS